MSIHVRKIGLAQRQLLRRLDLRNKLCAVLSGVLIVGGVAIVLFCVAVFVAREPEPEFIVYVPPAENLLMNPEPVSRKLTSRTAEPSVDSAIDPIIIVAEEALVEIPEIEILPEEPLELDFSACDQGVMEGADAVAGAGSGVGEVGLDGSGEGMDSGGGLGTKDGGGSALEGTFYDLKLWENGSPSGVRGDGFGTLQVVDRLNLFFQRHWSAKELDDYYQSKQRLFASFFFLPVARAAYGPIAYECDDVCRPSAWVAVYRGKVRAPKSGRFRFVGTGDDTLAVRFNNELVLEAGYHIPTIGGMQSVVHRRLGQYRYELHAGLHKELKDHEMIRLNGIPRWNREVGGLTAGKVFEVEKGQVYPIEVLISEIPGGLFGFMLLIEDMSKNLPRGHPNNEYDLFRTNSSKPDEAKILERLREAGCAAGRSGKLEAPPYNADSPIWQVVP